jgi:scyllo-inositol 2-dehydrogenase (NADP+)
VDDFVAAVDPDHAEAAYDAVSDVPLDTYDAALVCTPDAPKYEILQYLLANGKHALVEKPLWAPTEQQLIELQTLAQENGATLYTAYNHRFEPNFVHAGEAIRSGRLGRIYSCRMFYGNGTARLVRDSAWRDTGAGVLPDLGSHLLDTAAFWFGDLGENFRVISADWFENKAPDHVVVGSQSTSPRLELEMTLLMWRNHFTCDILCEKGSIHLRSLCKWGPATYTERRRVLPSGRPDEETETWVQADPTWQLEYAHFKQRCETGAPTDLSRDIWLHRVLGQLAASIPGTEAAAP